MATLTLTYDTGNVTLATIMNAFAEEYGYQDTINGQPNPESKADFARRIVRQYIVSVIRANNLRHARAAADASVNDAPII